MPPLVSSVSPTQGPVTGGTPVVITGSDFIGATAVRFGAVNATYTVNSSTQITAVAPSAAAPGPVAVTVVTPAGTSNANVTYTYTPVAVPPTVTSVSPTSGPVTGGTVVTVTGTNFTGATAVRFGAVNATSFTVNSSTQITAVAPPGVAPGSVPVTVVTPAGTSNATVTFTYTPVVSPPTVTSVSPASGPVTGGTVVTVTGTDFTGATAVRFGTVDATSFTVDSSTQITAVAPPGTPGAVPVTVTTPAGTSAASPESYFFYAAGPILTAATPAQGPSAGGNTVTLTGQNLSNATSVLFGGTPAAFTVVSSTEIVAQAPPGAGVVNVTVTTPGGTSNPVAYAYVSAPTLTSVTPSSGPTAGGTVVTLTGTNLTTTTSVLFEGVPAAFTVISDTQVIATVPAGPPGPASVVVTTAGGTSGAVTFERVPPPEV
ncbi:IPT/TIG domain-containing protein [Streptomyces thermogriseus]|uniref:IPT/TIG domain-containing protein n=1 Tax=Streptomyces thermogriseus TaxID=75292 RepID=A0ABN1T3C5_9ACTN